MAQDNCIKQPIANNIWNHVILPTNFGCSDTELKWTFSDLNISEYLKLGRKLIDIYGTLLLFPLWDTDKSRNKLGLLRKTFLQKCRCAKSSCRTKRCHCKSSGSFCSNICSCNDCENRQVVDGDDKEEEEDDEIRSASEDEDDDGELDYGERW